MENINHKPLNSQAVFEIPATVPVDEAVADLIFDYTNLNDLTTMDTARDEARSFLHQHPKIKYANEMYVALKACRGVLRGVAAGMLTIEQIIGVYTDIGNILNKIEGE